MKTKTAVLSVRMSPEEKRAIEEQAKKLGLTVRQYLTRKPEHQAFPQTGELRQMLREDLNVAFTQFKTETIAREDGFRNTLMEFFKKVLS